MTEAHRFPCASSWDGNGEIAAVNTVFLDARLIKTARGVVSAYPSGKHFGN
ncbi:hypothetical protein [Rhodococcus sp. ACPA1]|uniref:hypothetical protein n=1 Tax=Rhodococcus sp. ACPA1 TaxID=2028572 RepID=UPI0015CEB49F|nr:hypothetical protein [Rhodococcus sp. ACPA1]